MPVWIHQRAENLAPKMEKTYGKEKARQVAFAVGTQQAHRLGKTPKRYGTAEGKRIAMRKFHKPRREYRKTAMWRAYWDEARSLMEVDQ